MKNASYALVGAVALAGMSLSTASVCAQQNSNIGSQGMLGGVEVVDKIYGKEVLSSDNQKVGKLDDLIVDLESGRILYGVVSANNGYVAVPPGIFTATPTAKDNYVHAKVTKSQIDSAPKFDNSASDAQQWGQGSFVYEVYQKFGQPFWWQGSAPANQGVFHNVHKASVVLGMNVEDVNNQSIGKVNEMVANLPQGRLLYVIFQPASSLNLGNNLYALPPQAVTLSHDYKNLVTGIDKQKLAAAPHFDKSHWPDLQDANFASQVYQYYGKQAYFQRGGGAVQPTGR